MVNVKDIVGQVLVRLGIDDRYDIDNIPEDDSEIAIIVKCLNMIVSEIASDYVEVLHTETMQVVNNIIPYENFSNRLICVKKIILENGLKVNYKLYPTHIKLDNCSSAEVTYCYLPKELSLKDIVDLPPNITLLALVFGTLGEYCLINGRYEDSMIYDKRYREMLRVANRATKEIKLKARSW